LPIIIERPPQIGAGRDNWGLRENAADASASAPEDARLDQSIEAVSVARIRRFRRPVKADQARDRDAPIQDLDLAPTPNQTEVA